MRLSYRAELYRNDEPDPENPPDWVLIENVSDLTISDSYEEANVTSRAGLGFTQTEPTLRNIELSFTMQNIEDDDEQNEIIDAYIARLPLELLVIDSPLDEEEWAGIRGTFKVFSLTRNQAISDAQTFDVVMKPCVAANPVEDVEFEEEEKEE